MAERRLHLQPATAFPGRQRVPFPRPPSAVRLSRGLGKRGRVSPRAARSAGCQRSGGKSQPPGPPAVLPLGRDPVPRGSGKGALGAARPPPPPPAAAGPAPGRGFSPPAPPRPSRRPRPAAGREVSRAEEGDRAPACCSRRGARGAGSGASGGGRHELPHRLQHYGHLPGTPLLRGAAPPRRGGGGGGEGARWVSPQPGSTRRPPRKRPLGVPGRAVPGGARMRTSRRARRVQPRGGLRRGGPGAAAAAATATACPAVPRRPAASRGTRPAARAPSSSPAERGERLRAWTRPTPPAARQRRWKKPPRRCERRGVRPPVCHLMAARPFLYPTLPLQEKISCMRI